MISFHLKYAIKYGKLQKKGVATGPNMRISDVCGCKTRLTLLCYLRYILYTRHFGMRFYSLMQGTASYCTHIIIVIAVVVVVIIITIIIIIVVVIITSKMYQKQTYHLICLVNTSDI